AGLLDGLLRGGRREIDRARLVVRAGAGRDARALTDPLVARVDRADEVVVGDGVLAARGTHRENARVCGERGLVQYGSHSDSPAAEDQLAFSARRSRAATRSSGVLRATAGVPRRPRLARPVRAPAGANSTRPVMPASANEAMHRSQRTGF